MILKFDKKSIKIVSEDIDKTQAIEISGLLLVNKGCVTSDYIKSMHAREKIASVAIGNGVAIPHGTDDGKSSIKKTGLCLTLFPNGINWDEHKIFCAIGLSAKDDSHVEALSIIATVFSQKQTSKELAQLTELTEINKFIARKYKEFNY